MGTRKNQLWQFALLMVGLLAVGCGEEEDDPTPTGPNLNLDGGTPALDGSLNPNNDAAADAGAPTGECKGANGCYSCAPKTNTQLLNACASGCVPFDNAKRLPGYQPGQLPPL